MEREFTFDALFYPQIVCLNETTLKCLLLLYDRIFYLPIDVHLNPGCESISKRWSTNDSFLFGAFGSQSDMRANLMYSSEPSGWDEDLRNLMASYDKLEERGICVPINETSFQDTTRAHPLQAAVDADMKDREFRERCYKYMNSTFSIPNIPEENTMKGGGVALRLPKYKGSDYFAALCSERLNTSLLMAGLNDLFPVSDQDSFIALYHNKLKRALQDREFATKHRYTLKTKARFNMLSWHILTEVATVESIRKKSIDQILKYKEEIKPQSLKFRNFMLKIETELSREPWDKSAREEVDQLVRKDVIPEVDKIREEKWQIWNRLFHDAPGKVVTIGSLGPALRAFFIGNVSYLDLLQFGVSAALLASLPSLLEARKERKELQRNALFFVVELSS